MPPSACRNRSNTKGKNSELIPIPVSVTWSGIAPTALQAGFQAYITKAANPIELLTVVVQLLDH
ncbi:hypothetical protein IQ250_02505 [Pseudanabaenaceae cyanobacterium LEGE 13415]|nr:hypothetical protein [Pseudanabaenaceae cyanobacterium LEGE 13415]